MQVLASALLPFLIQFCSARSLWSSKPANASDILRTAYPIGNGFIGVLPYGEPGNEIWNINRDSLWSGGPFENSSYQGGLVGPRYQYLPGIREWIFQNGTGNVSRLMGDDNNYGSFAVLGNLTVDVDGITNVSEYRRALDLTTGVHTTMYSANGARFQINNYCSYPDEICVYDVNSTQTLPVIIIGLSNELTNSSLIDITCSNDQLQLRGRTQSDIGMIYQANVQALGHIGLSKCGNGSLVLPKNSTRRATFVFAAGTDFDQSKGIAASNFSFRGTDPASYVRDTVSRAVSKTADQLLETHLADYQPLINTFQFDLPDTQDSAGLETADLVSRYTVNSTSGDPYLEALTFDLARYLFLSSSRPGSLPPNLQGKWATLLSNAWSADYHLDINLQMNHWHVDQTGLGELQTALWDFLTQNAVPRGRETAKLTYNAPGWVTHSVNDIFGSTAMQTGEEYWFDYPISAAWLMQHVWDYFDYSQDVKWLQETGYPMLKDISLFWLSQLQEDQYFKDGTLVVNPCTSAEHGPTTFGCTHYQQLIHQLFETTLQVSKPKPLVYIPHHPDIVRAAAMTNDQDPSFLQNLQTSLTHLDKGLHIGSWNQIQEWKLDIDAPNDTHRHISNLVGWYPSNSLASYLNGYTNSTIQSAIRTTLLSRGPGIADSNAGWEKVWRAACWARLNATSQAYYELRLTIAENWAGNLLSMYSGKSEPFQIDANFGFAGAVLSMLVVDLPGKEEVVMGPAIPRAWGGGSVRGLRLRGGGTLDFEWDGEGVVVGVRGDTRGRKIVDKFGKVLK